MPTLTQLADKWGEDLIRRKDAITAIWSEDINPSDDGMVFEAQSHIDRDIRLIPSVERGTTAYCGGCEHDKQIEQMAHEYTELEAKYHALQESAEPRRGEWKPYKTESDGRVVLWECSECGNVIFSESEADRAEFHKWCGWCGADMRERKE